MHVGLGNFSHTGCTVSHNHFQCRIEVDHDFQDGIFPWQEPVSFIHNNITSYYLLENDTGNQLELETRDPLCHACLGPLTN